MMIELLSPETLKKFYTFNLTHYKNSNKFIHPLQVSLKDTFDIKNNPYWLTVNYKFFIAKKDRKPVGRIAVMAPKNNLQQAHFGFFECTNDLTVARQLFEKAEKTSIDWGCKHLNGPFNPSLNYELGVLTEGFQNEPFFMMTYNYEDLIKKCGYHPEEKFYSYLLETKNFIEHSKLLRVANTLKNNPEIIIRNVNLKNFEAEARAIFKIYNDAFKGHFGFVPFEQKEFLFMAKDMKQIINPSLLKLVFWNNEPVVFILTLPNLNEVLKRIKKGQLFPTGILKLLYFKNKISSVRVVNAAIKQKYQHSGLGALMYYSIFQEIKKLNLKTGQLSWIAESNKTMLKIVEELGAVKENTYAIYKKDL